MRIDSGRELSTLLADHPLRRNLGLDENGDSEVICLDERWVGGEGYT